MTDNHRLSERLAAKCAHGGTTTPWQFILYGGLGDHVLWLSLLAPFRQQVRAPVVIYCDPRTIELARLYATRSFDELVECESLTEEEVSGLCTGMRLVRGHPILAWHPALIGDEVSALRDRDRAITDVIRHILGLAPATALARPLVAHADYHIAQQEMRRHGLPVGRTVLLAPMAKSQRVTLPDAWWAELASALTRQGYVVATNVATRARGFDQRGIDATLSALPGTVAVDIPLSAMIPFSELCGTVVMVRSGLSDLLAFGRARTWVVWPYAATDDAYFSKLFQIWSLQRLYPCHDMTEVRQEGSAPFDPEPLLAWIARGRPV